MLLDMRGWHMPEDYEAIGNEAEKTAYYIAHFQELTPLWGEEGAEKFSVPYFQMLGAFVTNSGDIQHKLDEKECMRKLLKDLQAVVEGHVDLSNDQKGRVRRMISEYRRHTEQA